MVTDEGFVISLNDQHLVKTSLSLLIKMSVIYYLQIYKSK